MMMIVTVPRPCVWTLEEAREEEEEEEEGLFVFIGYCRGTQSARC